ncbi:MAG: carbohydrate ABC transporter permease [Chloroflexi bacterium]|nr:carbohydrate ABC transporter permease [Chloroflexota bacterium]
MEAQMQVSQTVSARAPTTRRLSHKRSYPQVISLVLRYLLLVVLAMSFVLPFYWMATSALKDDSQVYTVPPVWMPNPAHWNNFPDVWLQYDFSRYMMNTVVRYVIPSMLGVTLASAVVAYGFSRLRWPGRDALFFLCLATMMVPFQVTMVPLFVVFKQLGWLNSYRPLVIPAFFGGPYYIFMLRQFFLSIPEELSDAARIDGANEFGILFRIILPLARPALTVVALFQVMGAWNDYLGPLIYINKESLYPLALAINRLRTSLTGAFKSPLAYPYLMAVSTVATLPILVGFFFVQRTFIEGISLTGIKG